MKEEDNKPYIYFDTKGLESYALGIDDKVGYFSEELVKKTLHLLEEDNKIPDVIYLTGRK